MEKLAAERVRIARSMSDNSIKSHLSVDFGMTHEELDTMTREELIHTYLVKKIWA